MIGDILRIKSKELGLSDAEVARRLDISPRRYAHYVSNRSEPNLSLLKNICRVLQIAPAEFLGDEDSEQTTPTIKAKYLGEALKLTENEIIQKNLALNLQDRAELIIKHYKNLTSRVTNEN